MNAFNPYHQWLELDAANASPSYYEMLGVPADESDSQKIVTAADRARSKVRSARPGEHATAWSNLLDELANAKTTLTDPQQRAAYDAALASGSAPSTTIGAGSPSQPAASTETAPAAGGVDPMMMPPSAPFASNAAAQPQPTPAAETAPQQPAPAQPMAAAYPTPVATPATPTAAPVTPTAAPIAPNPTAVTPTAAQAAYDPNDPMAPVGASAAPAAPFASAPTAQPVTAVANPMDPMAPAGMAPQATATSNATPSPFAGGAGHQQEVGVAIPIGPATGGLPDHDATAVKGAPSPATRQKQASKNAWKTPAIVGGVIAGMFVIAGIGYIAMSGNNDTVAEVEPNDNDGPDANPAIPDKVIPPVVPPVTPPTPPVRPNPTDGGEMSDGGEPPVDPVAPPVEPKPTPPKPLIPPTSAELNQLADALIAARSALETGKISEAKTSVQAAEAVAKLPEHREMVTRVEQLTEHVELFYAAVQRGLEMLNVGDEVAVLHTVVTVKESGPTGLTIDLAGAEMQFKTPETIPHALAKYLAEKGLDMNAAKSRAIIGSSHAILSDPQKQSEATGWFNQAAAGGADVEGMIAMLSDRYETIRPEGVATNDPPMTDPTMTDPPAGMAPTPAELKMLADNLKDARLALEQRQYDPVLFFEHIAAAKKVAKLPEHVQMVARLEKLGALVSEYWMAVSAGLETLAGGTNIDVDGTVVGIVEADSKHLIVRIAGARREYPKPQQIPPGLARYIAGLGIDLAEPHSQAVIGSIYAVNSDPAKRNEAKAWFDKATAGGDDSSDVVKALSDNYESL